MKTETKQTPITFHSIFRSISVISDIFGHYFQNAEYRPKLGQSGLKKNRRKRNPIKIPFPLPCPNSIEMKREGRKRRRERRKRTRKEVRGREHDEVPGTTAVGAAAFGDCCHCPCIRWLLLLRRSATARCVISSLSSTCSIVLFFSSPLCFNFSLSLF